MKLRMLGGRILLKPLDWDASKTIIAIRHGRPVRGEVIAIGPGENPKKYKAGSKGPRSIMEYSKRFQPTELKVGDIVELGGLNVFDGQGYAFHEEWIDNVKHIICHENDVACVVEPEAKCVVAS